jgi:hypothetical protein
MKGLEVLGSTESQEVVAEVRSHLVEATAEADGNELAALAQFGSPEVLATRILQERGVLHESSRVREAPARLRWAALGLDVARWLLLLWILLSWIFFIGVGGSPTPLVITVSWLYTAVVVAGTVWWWGWRWRRSQATSGMAALGLRRVRMGQASRVVRERDIPGASPSWAARGAYRIWVIIIVLLFAICTYGLVSGAAGSSRSNHDKEIQQAITDSGQASLLVQNVYAALTAGQEIRGFFAPSIAAEGDTLFQRYASHPFDYFLVDRIEMPDYRPLTLNGDSVGLQTEAYVTVTEFYQDGNQTSYRYTVVFRMTDFEKHGNTSSWAIQHLIEEVVGPLPH